jgi:hypothetical protein
MAGLAVFGYASLVSTASASETLGRPVGPGPAARLHGWRRRWSTVRDNRTAEKTFARADSGEIPPYVLGLNVEPTDEPEPAPNGVLIEVTEAELERLDLREMRFRRIDVTDAIERADPAGAAGYDRIVAYSARPENHAPETPPDAIVIAAYARTVERCFAALGPGQLELYRATTAPSAVEVVEATLVHDRIPPGNPRDW